MFRPIRTFANLAVLALSAYVIPAHATYWSLFNIEGETAQGARYVTYANLNDMLNDENRTLVVAPDGGFVPENVIGSGSNGDIYWSLFNIEGETAQGARYVTYANLNDMLNDENRTLVVAPDGGFVPENVIGSGSNGDIYWSLFNIEGETAQGARYVTYANLNDMLNDENRTLVVAPDGGFVPENVIGSGSNGDIYWSLFNIEGETAQGARYVTYANLNDMLNDENRTLVVAPDGGFVPENVIGSGSNGDIYWSLFNIEGETAQGARYVTYANLNDMLNDENRTLVVAPDGGFVPENVIGSGSDETRTIGTPIPEPGILALIGCGLASIVFTRRRKMGREAQQQ
jgi:sulfur carrier protein ThiS